MARYVKVTWPTEAIEIEPISSLVFLEDYLNDGAVGEMWKLEIVEMTEDEYLALPEFEGP